MVGLKIHCSWVGWASCLFSVGDKDLYLQGEYLHDHGSWLHYLSAECDIHPLAHQLNALQNVCKCLTKDSNAKWQLGATMLIVPHGDGASYCSCHSAGACGLGNTCFANTVIQCLVAIPELVGFLVMPL